MKANDTVELRDDYHFGAEHRSLATILGGVAVAALVLALLIGWTSSTGLQRFAYSYLLNFCYFLSFSLAALCFVVVQHLTKAGWSVAWRRLAELLAAVLPYWGLLFLPVLAFVLFGGGTLFEWNDRELLKTDALLQKKVAYLNATFFTVRAVVYFVIWIILARYYSRLSLAQDQSGDRSLTLRMQRWSGPSIYLFAFTLTFAAFDWLMSLEPHWFSTIFGVYYFAGSAVGFFALLILLAQIHQRRGRLRESITVEHYHDLGKLLFGFVFFWGYIAFSQYMLIWYANIPEETGWFLVRQSGGWLGISLLLLFGHFLIPFPGLLARWVRRSRSWLGFWAGLLLVMHWIDLYWVVMPQCTPQGPAFGLVDALCLLGLAAAYGALVIYVSLDRALIAVKDPRLAEALAFKNV